MSESSAVYTGGQHHIVEQAQPHSVELTLGQNGKVGLTVKVYGADIRDAYEQAKVLFAEARREVAGG